MLGGGTVFIPKNAIFRPLNLKKNHKNYQRGTICLFGPYFHNSLVHYKFIFNFSMSPPWIKCLGIVRNRKMSWKFWLNYWNIQTDKIAMFKQKSYKQLRFSRKFNFYFFFKEIIKKKLFNILFFTVEINPFWNPWLTWNFLIICFTNLVSKLMMEKLVKI